MELTNKYHKTQTLCKWKRIGVINDNLEEIYETYINTTECNHCGKVFESTRDRHLDHCHETGLFRKIVCRRCNTYDNYINFPAGIPSEQERNKIKCKKYRDKNKERTKEYNKQYKKQYCEKNRDKINENQRKKRKEKKAIMINLT